MNTPTRRRGRPASRAQALVEFALVAPIFFMILFSIIEFGRAVYYIQILNNAAREGARYAIVHGDRSANPTGPPPGFPLNTNIDPYASAVKTTVRSYAVGVSGDVGSSDFVVTVCYVAPAPGPLYECPDNNAGNDMGTGNNGRTNPPQSVNVTVKYVFRPLLAAIVPMPSFTLTGGSTLVVNH
jgi:Flp pilus assembly protein TadG